MKDVTKKIPQLAASPFAATELVDTDNLSAEDKAVLEKEEAIIEAGRKSFLDVAAALVRVRDYRDGILYTARYGSFEAYCRERWEFGPSQAYRLISAAEISLSNSTNKPMASGLS